MTCPFGPALISTRVVKAIPNLITAAIFGVVLHSSQQHHTQQHCLGEADVYNRDDS